MNRYFEQQTISRLSSFNWSYQICDANCLYSYNDDLRGTLKRTCLLISSSRCHAVNVADNAAYYYDIINKDLRAVGIDVQAEEIIDIIDGYKGKGYAVSTQHELGGYQQLVKLVIELKKRLSIGGNPLEPSFI